MSGEQGFDVEIDEQRLYEIAGGGEAFYRTRVTDGKRPQIYAELIAPLERGSRLLVGLACGDSAIEHALLEAIVSPECAYLGVDISADMEAFTRATFARALRPLRPSLDFMRADIMDPATVAALADRLHRAGAGFATLVGRTFGNLPTDRVLAALGPLAARGTIYVDLFHAEQTGDERRFMDRMSYVAEHSRDFLLGPLRAAGVATDTLRIAFDFEREPAALACRFQTTLPQSAGGTAPAGRYRLFTIRMFDVESLLGVAASHGLVCRLRHRLADQVLPMSLLGLHATA